MLIIDDHFPTVTGFKHSPGGMIFHMSHWNFCGIPPCLRDQPVLNHPLIRLAISWVAFWGGLPLDSHDCLFYPIQFRKSTWNPQNCYFVKCFSFSKKGYLQVPRRKNPLLTKFIQGDFLSPWSLNKALARPDFLEEGWHWGVPWLLCIPPPRTHPT